MNIRIGTVSEMILLWYKQYTTEFFTMNIENKNAEFWTIEENGQLFGELYAFFSLEDKDFADGEKTAYLCAFRINDGMQDKGYGSMLMSRVLERLKELEFSYVSIGVEPDETANIRLYNRLGFNEKIKVLSLDPCDVDCNFHPLSCKEYILLRRAL